MDHNSSTILCSGPTDLLDISHEKLLKTNISNRYDQLNYELNLKNYELNFNKTSFLLPQTTSGQTKKKKELDFFYRNLSVKDIEIQPRRLEKIS